jgi:sulfatase maturation enzyme AslB (radical SAM superfamily)
MIRGEKDGYRTKVDGLARLKELGGTDLGFAAVIQDENVADIVELFRFTVEKDYELSTSTLHNGFQFHKTDNAPYDRLRTASHIEDLIVEQLKTNNIKNWFRAYINLGLLARVLGNKRLMPCRHGYESVFIDPWGDVFACNVRPDLYMGSLVTQTWGEIISGPRAQKVLDEVDKCQQNCWMAGVAKSAMRNPRFTKLPRLKPFTWVLLNKTRLLLGKKIDFRKYVDYRNVQENSHASKRNSYLDKTVKRRIQKKEDPHYSQPGGYINH